MNELRTFSEVKDLATRLAESFNISVEIIKSDGEFIVRPAVIPLRNLKSFADSVYLFGTADPKLLSLLDHVNTSLFTSVDLAWRDHESGLLWDSSRIICGVAATVFPNDRPAVMNAVRYGGSSNWRLPSLDELGTLDTVKLDRAGVESYGDQKGSVKFWSSNESIYSGPEAAYLEIVSKRRGDQRYREQQKDRQTRGDGYTEIAQTIMVSD